MMVNLAYREGSGKRATRVEENALSNHKPSNFRGAVHCMGWPRVARPPAHAHLAHAESVINNVGFHGWHGMHMEAATMATLGSQCDTQYPPRKRRL